MKTVLVDRENCIGCTNCTHVCPKIFEMKEGKSLPKRAAEESEIPEVELAIAQCPVQVISWEGEENSKKQSSTGGLFSFFSGIFGKKKSSSIQLLSKRYLTKDVALFQFSKPEKNALPGQFYTLQFQNSGKDIQRSYSLFDEDEESISFCIHLTPNGEGSRILRNLEEKEQVKYSGPFGQFLLQESSSPKVFIATGTGVAPIFMMLQKMSKDIPATLLFGVRNEEDIFLEKELSAFPNLKTIITLSAPSEQWKGSKGRVTDILPTLSFSPKTEFYLCGNPNMIEDGRLYLQKEGVLPENVFYEHFS